MTFILSKILWFVVRPSTFLLLAGCLGLVATWARWRRVGMVLVTLSIGGTLAVMVLPIDQWLTLPLEDRFARPDPPPAHVDGIIVLGGVIDSAMTKERAIPSLSASAERITEAVILARKYPDATLLFTGGDGDLIPSTPTEADFAKQLWVALGVPDRSIVLENASRNTVENAVFSRAIVHPTPGQTWLLITSASHMPRSVGIFREAGWPVVPWPVGYKSGRSPAVRYMRQFGDRIVQLDWAVHEWIGLVAYRLLGRTDALFPGPQPPV